MYNFYQRRKGRSSVTIVNVDHFCENSFVLLNVLDCISKSFTPTYFIAKLYIFQTNLSRKLM